MLMVLSDVGAHTSPLLNPFAPGLFLSAWPVGGRRYSNFWRLTIVRSSIRFRIVRAIFMIRLAGLITGEQLLVDRRLLEIPG